MYQPVDGIAALEPKPSLLTSARRLPFGYDVWRTGITFRDTSLAVGSRWPYSPAAGRPDKVDAVAPGIPVFVPFTIYLPSECDDSAYTRDDELADEARRNADAVTAWNVARELWTGETVNDVVADNPSLQGPFPGATDEFAAAHMFATAENPVTALGQLIQAYQDGTQKGGVTIHAPVVVVPYLLAEKVITRQGDVYVGPSGSIIVPGPGYPAGAGDFGPRTAAEPTGTPASADQVWMYATGPVEYDLTDVRLLPEEERLRRSDPRTNLWNVWAERQAIVRFDPAAVWASLVTVPQAA